MQGWRETEPGDPIPQDMPERLERPVLRALAEDVISESRASELRGKPMTEFYREQVGARWCCGRRGRGRMRAGGFGGVRLIRGVGGWWGITRNQGRLPTEPTNLGTIRSNVLQSQ